jgi:hypothetical protein
MHRLAEYVAVDEVLATAMVAGSRVSTTIVRSQTTATVAAAGDTLQECAAFCHGLLTGVGDADQTGAVNESLSALGDRWKQYRA